MVGSVASEPLMTAASGLSESILARRAERKKMKGWTPDAVDYTRKDAVRFLRMNHNQRHKKREAARFGVAFLYPKKWAKKIITHIFKKFPDLNPPLEPTKPELEIEKNQTK